MEDITAIHFKQKLMSTREVSRALCMSRSAIWNMVKNNKISVVWHNKDKTFPYSMWLINTDELANYLNEMTKKINQ